MKLWESKSRKERFLLKNFLRESWETEEPSHTTWEALWVPNTIALE